MLKDQIKLMNEFGYLPVYGPTQQDVNLGKNQLYWLQKAYPGYRWVIEVRDTIITVVNETLAHDWGFRLREKMLDNDGKVIRQFAGELLERYGLHRGGMNAEEISSLRKDFRGSVARQ